MWDVFPDGERLGGAPFNFSVHASRLGHEVVFLTAVGDDARGVEARRRAAALGLPPEFIQVQPDAPTGTVTVKLDEAGRPAFAIHRPAAYDAVRIDDALTARIRGFAPEWVYYGTLHQHEPRARAATQALFEALPTVRRFYDMNLRPRSYSPELVRELMESAHAIKVNEEEAAAIDSMFGGGHAAPGEFTAHWSGKLGWSAIAVTRGERGAAVRIGGEYAEVAGMRVTVADTVGAGDAFAAAFLHGIGGGWDARRTAEFANRLGAVVASRPGAVPEWSLADLAEVCGPDAS